MINKDEQHSPVFVFDPDGSVRFRYRNHRGEVAMRRVQFCKDDPPEIYWGETRHHPGKRWLLEVFDTDRQAMRTFALECILSP